MPEPTVVEAPKPPAEPPKEPPTEQQVTEQYLEKRAKGETDNLPVPEPQIKEEKPADVAVPEQQTVDAYLAERAERVRKQRGGKQAKIDELTREKAELEARAKAAEEAKAALEAKNPKESQTIPTTPNAVAAELPKPPETPTVKPQPKFADYTDIDKYNADMALWAAEQTKPKEHPKVEEPKPNGQVQQVSQIRKEEFDRFLEKGKRFVAGHPDFNETLEAAHVRGLTMSEAARTAITRLAVPEVAYWLAKPENDLAARSLMQMDDLQQVVEVGRIAERLKVSPSDFVSNAPQPGLRLSGSASAIETPLNELTDTDEYIRRRKMERRNGRGR